MTMSVDPKALYVHIPFCRRKCGYCDFYSIPLAGGEVAGGLVDALLRELNQWADGRDLRPETVFVGGGTPTVLPPADLGRLLRRVVELCTPGAEITVEANPATVDVRMAETLAAAGVNRVSIGAQSFDPGELAVLDREHEPRQVAETVAACRQAGLERISVDLIFGIPGQTLDSWRTNLAAAVGLGVEHLSSYSLTYEPDTPLHRRMVCGDVQPVDDDLDADMYELAIDLLAEAGLEQYEISNFARPGAECRHNLVYWHNEPYVGVGPAAAGFVDGIRYKNVSDIDGYVAAIGAGRSAWEEHERPDRGQSARESAMLGLRLVAGMERGLFAARYGADPAEHFADPVLRFVERGLVEVTPTHVRLTRAGRLLGDLVIRDFLDRPDEV